MSGALIGSAVLSGSSGGGGGGSALAATSSTAYLTGYVLMDGVAVTSAPAIVSVTGGVPPYSYDWERTFGDTTIYPNVDTGYATYFYRLILDGGSYIASWRCKVTDSVGTIVYASPSTLISLESLA